MKSLATLRAALVAAITVGMTGNAHAALQFWRTDGTAGTWLGSNWSETATPTGGTPWTSGNTAQFTANTGAITFASTSVTGVTVDAGVNARITAAGTWSMGGAVMPVAVDAGGIFDMSSQGISTTAGSGLNKTGAGILYIANTSLYPGGFTLGGGTVILGTTSANVLGASLTITGGTFAAKASTVPNASALNSMAVNGNFTMGAVTTGVTSGNAVAGTNMTLGKAATTMDLGGSTRTISIGANGQYTMAGIISNGGLIIDSPTAATGRIILTSLTSDYSGGTTIMTDATLSTTGASSNGGFTAGPLGTGTLTIDGGEYIASSSGTNTIANNITLNNVSTNEIAVGGTSTLSGNITGDGGFRKSSSGTLILTGTNNYFGPTDISNGTLALGSSGALGTSGTISFTGGTLQWSSSNTTDYSARFSNATSQAYELDTNGQSVTLGSALTSSGGSLTKLGTNTLTLGVANTFSGTTTVTTGTLNLADQLALQNSTLTSAGVTFDQSVGGNAFTLGGLSGSGNIALQNNAGPPVGIALSVGNNNENTTYTGVLSGPGSLAKIGTGSLTLTIANTYTGGTTLDAGTVNVNASAAVFGTGLLTLNTGAALDNTTGTNRTLGGTVPQLWNGNFAFLGTRALNLGAGAVTMGGNIDVTVGVTTPTPTQDAVNFALTVGGVISDSGNNYTLTKSGPGRFYLSGQNTFTGGVIVNGGSVHANEQNSNLGGGMGPFGTGTLALNSGRMLASSTGTTVSTIENDIALTGPAYTAGSGNLITANGTLTLSGTISGTGGLGKSGSGTTTLTGNNSHQGGTTINGGTLSLGSSDAIGTTGTISFSEGTLQFTASNTTDYSSRFSTEDNQPISLDTNGQSVTLASNLISIGGSLTKLGDGALTLSGANTYSGTTSVNAGTLLVNGSHTGNGDYTVAAGATLGGMNGTIGSTVTVNSGGTIAPGASAGTLTVGGLVVNDGAIGKFELQNTIGAHSPGGASDYLDILGTLDLSLITTTITLDIDDGNAGDIDKAGSWVLMTADTVNPGSFSLSSVTIAGIDAGFTPSLSIAANVINPLRGDLVLTTTPIAPPGLEGDYNENDVVDAADYVMWRMLSLTGGSLQNEIDENPTAGVTNDADYDAWRGVFGNVPAASSAFAANAGTVPEPGTVFLAVVGVLGLLIARRTTRDCRAKT